MKNIYLLLLVISLCYSTISCGKNDRQETNISSSECDFVEDTNSTDGLLDESEIEIIKNCRNSEITDDNQITENLIGEWKLVGFGDGWFSYTSQPCGFIKIGPEELTFEFHNEYLDTISVHQWEIENNWLKVEPPEKHLSINLFCDQYMKGNFSDFGVYSIDVDQYIYEKVK